FQLIWRFARKLRRRVGANTPRHWRELHVSSNVPGGPPTGPPKITLRAFCCRCQVGEYLKPSKTSQSRSRASILAQGFSGSSMFYTGFFRRRAIRSMLARVLIPVLTTTLVILTLSPIPAKGQDQPAQPAQPAQAAPPSGQQQEPPPAAGGPQSDTGPYAIPKKKEEPPAPPPVEKPKKIEGMPDYSIRVDVPLVNVDVLVTTKDGQFISTLKKDNFKV